MGARIGDHAAEYAERLGWCVFPCKGKRPAASRENGGKGCHDAANDPATVRDFWRRCLNANIGLATGEKSGIWVLDIDGDEGRASLAALEGQHGRLPDTLRQITGSGGEHYLFSYDRGRPVRNKARKFMLPSGQRISIPGIDVRGDGGYIIAPPSIHPETWRAYQWTSDPFETKLAFAPEWLISLVENKKLSTQKIAPQRPPIETHWGPRPKYSRAAIDKACGNVASASIGQQEVTLYREAYSVGQLIASGFMPRDAALQLLAYAASLMSNSSNKRPWTISEIHQKIERAFIAAENFPREPLR